MEVSRCQSEIGSLNKRSSRPAPPLHVGHPIGQAFPLASQLTSPSASEQLIAVDEHILTRIMHSEYPFYYAGVQISLGVSYLRTPSENRAANLEQAIRCFHEALHIVTPEIAPEFYVQAQTNLGLICY
jgi:hypothetical protein